MNTDTGEILRGSKAIREAQARGEPIVPVSDKIARLVQLGQAAKEATQTRKRRRRWQGKIARAARKRNRG